MHETGNNLSQFRSHLARRTIQYLSRSQ